MGTEIHEQMALDYLKAVLYEDAPHTITPVAVFDEKPLQDEGKVTVFAFNATLGGNPDEPFYVVAGQTVPNYYPQWGLDADQAYSLHLGTRFMLVVQVQHLALSELPPTLEEDLREELAGMFPGEVIGEIKPVAAFRADEHKHAICRARIGNEDLYVMGADLPVGVYREVQLPPHVVYRWHLGNIIRMERPEEDTEETAVEAEPA